MGNYSFYFNKIIIIPNLFLLLILFACKSAVPIKEMSTAKLGISRAVEVKSEKYAPEELDKAKEDLLKSHDYIRDEDIDKAKKAAEGSLANSNEAIKKSLPLLAADTLTEAKDVFEEASQAFAEEYAPEEYSAADEKIAEAELLNNVRKFWESYLESREAITYAANARDKALSNITALNERINTIKEKTSELEAVGGRDIAPEEMKLIDDNLGQAESLIENKNLKEAFEKITEADSALQIAGLKIWKQIASDKIKVAEEVYNQIDNSKHRNTFLNDLENAGGLISEAKDLFANESYYESTIRSEEAIDILNSISIAMEKKKEEIRFEESRVDEGKKTDVNEYIVKYNPKNRDCLWKIAMNLYKDARLWPLIYMANRDQIKDPDLIFPGQKLLIPPIPKRTDSAESEDEEVNLEAEPAEKETMIESEVKKEESDFSTDKEIDKNIDKSELNEDQTEQNGEETIEEGEETEDELYEEKPDEDSELDEEIPAEISSIYILPFHRSYSKGYKS